MSKKNNNKEKIAGIILIISALFLGALIIILVAGNKKKITIDGANAKRDLSAGVPLPTELIDADKVTYFPYMEIPDSIFNKMVKVSFADDCPVAREDLRYLQVLYWGTDSAPHKGELIVNKAIADKAQSVFFELYKSAYQIESIKLVDEYGANDEISMSYNNTSCFNARRIDGSNEWSKHAYGMAIDINPLYNPYVKENGKVLPIKGEKYADRSLEFPMKIDIKDYAYRVFTKYGFDWGGEWTTVKDYQHFEKN